MPLLAGMHELLGERERPADGGCGCGGCGCGDDPADGGRSALVVTDRRA